MAVIFCVNTRILCGETVPHSDVFLGNKHPVIFKYQAEIVTPAVHNRRTVGDHQNLLIAHLFDQRIGSDGLAETHLAVPEHTIPLGKYAASLVNACFLLIAKDDFGLWPFRRAADYRVRCIRKDNRTGDFSGSKGISALFYRANGTNCLRQAYLEPLTAFPGVIEIVTVKAGAI